MVTPNEKEETKEENGDKVKLYAKEYIKLHNLKLHPC